MLALVFHLLSLAALFLLLQAQFVAAAQVVVYAGAVMVLYVFVVAYVGAAEAAHFKAPVGGAPARVRDRLRARAVRRAADRACSAPASPRSDTEGADRAGSASARPSRSARRC